MNKIFLNVCSYCFPQTATAFRCLQLMCVGVFNANLPVGFTQLEQW